MNKVELDKQIKLSIAEVVDNKFKIKLNFQDLELNKPHNPEHGHYSSNIAFSLSGRLGKNPSDVATEIVGELKTKYFDKETFEKIENLNGFINFYFANKYFYSWLEKILKEGDKFGNSDKFKGKNVQIEFISANPTGPLTLANGRGGYGGDVLANVFNRAGADVKREYYVNDGGNQVKMKKTSPKIYMLVIIFWIFWDGTKMTIYLMSS